MCANVPNDVRSGDENTDRTVDTVRRVDTTIHRHNQDRKLQSMMVVVRLDCLHQGQDFVFSILFGDFETKFSPD